MAKRNAPFAAKNALHPSQAQIGQAIARFEEEGDVHAPIAMVNLLKFKPRAEYADGRHTTLTGKEAYEIYGRGVTALVEKLGGKVVFHGDVRGLLLGSVADMWDVVAIAQYPSIMSMLEMSQSDEFKAIEVHRDAGLQGQLNIETILSKL